MQQLKSQEGKKQQLQKLRSHIASMSDSLQKEAVRQKIELLKKDTKKTVTDPLPLLSGPLTASLDSALQDNRIFPVIPRQDTDQKSLQQIS